MKAQSEKKILETSDEFLFRKSDMLSFDTLKILIDD